jgi:hypothetical protein
MAAKSPSSSCMSTGILRGGAGATNHLRSSPPRPVGRLPNRGKKRAFGGPRRYGSPPLTTVPAKPANQAHPLGTWGRRLRRAGGCNIESPACVVRVRHWGADRFEDAIWVGRAERTEDGVVAFNPEPDHRAPTREGHCEVMTGLSAER